MAREPEYRSTDLSHFLVDETLVTSEFAPRSVVTTALHAANVLLASTWSADGRPYASAVPCWARIERRRCRGDLDITPAEDDHVDYLCRECGASGTVFGFTGTPFDPVGLSRKERIAGPPTEVLALRPSAYRKLLASEKLSIEERCCLLRVGTGRRAIEVQLTGYAHQRILEALARNGHSDSRRKAPRSAGGARADAGDDSLEPGATPTIKELEGMDPEDAAAALSFGGPFGELLGTRGLPLEPGSRKLTKKQRARLFAFFDHPKFDLWAAVIARKLRDGGIGHRAKFLRTRLEDDDARISERAVALCLLAAHAPEVLEEFDAAEDDRLGTIDAVLHELVAEGEAGRAPLAVLPMIVDTLSDGPGPISFLERLEQVRTFMGAPAQVIFGRIATASHDPSARGFAIERIVAEGTRSARDWLDSARLRVADDETRRAIQTALARFVETTSDTGSPGRTATAMVTAVDADGSLAVFGDFAGDEEFRTVATVGLMLDGAIRRGWLHSGHGPAPIERIIEATEPSSSLPCARIPIGMAATMVREAHLRTSDLGRSLHPDAAPVVARFDRVTPLPLPEPPAVTRPLDAAAWPRLFADPAAANWRILDVDFLRLGIDPDLVPEDLDDGEQRRLAAEIDHPALRERLRAMLRHTWLVLHLSGEAERAAAFAAAYRGFEGDPAIRESVACLLARFSSTDGTRISSFRFGNHEFRSAVRKIVFASRRPKSGRDLAILDLTEALALPVKTALDELIEDTDGGDAHEVEAALAVAHFGAMVAVAAREAGTPARAIVLQSILAALPFIPPDAAAPLAHRVIDSTEEFLSIVCPACPVQCWPRLAERMDSAWFSTHHPARLRAPTSLDRRPPSPGRPRPKR